MIRYALQCEAGHTFEAWFADSDAYDAQAAKGLVECPHCGSTQVRKQIMAPAVASGGDAASKTQGGTPAQAFAEFAAKVRTRIAETHDYVGEKFADEARAMHDGEQESRPIYGEASAEEARALREDGAPVAAIPKAFAPTPPKKIN